MQKKCHYLIVKQPKKTVYFIIFAGIVSLLILIRIILLSNKYLSWQSYAKQITAYNKLILEDTTWTQWRPPENPENYIILWFFYLNYTLQVLDSKVMQTRPGITTNFLDIKCDAPDFLLEKLRRPPFGRVIVRSIKNGILSIAWHWSDELDKNDSLPKLSDHIVLSLDTIIISDSNWTIKLNNNWINSSLGTKYANLEILEVNKYSALIKVLTPQGESVVKLQCGNTVRVNYLAC